ncbi:2OG-Fe(II) oxygenase family protein [Kitasatospora sp. MAP5-34]|uniref:2OG-Fe(II) oxygenase family protein n=1 Tax=Kitasatospora sp. MAP5-34 TaxID=3035102 RepID=UPI0024771546|nr:2OG-Fe(II) oxygenase family protein [Kitasatospora sp. MAP5-34]MDH6575308.1 isopenicillin N synthase-like dioxygenase [Kitasatospora sp. MAP5-34]
MTSRPRHDWEHARLSGGGLEFDRPDGLRRALRDGFFFVDQPAGTKLAAGDRFAERFYLPAVVDHADPYCGHRELTERQIAPRQGYFSRDEDQTEQFFLESRHWDAVFPAALVRQAEAMRDFSLSVLRAVLCHLDLPERLWDEATGHSLSQQGTYHLTFNHFRPEVRARGLNIHKDSGWVTVLRSVEPGLEVDRAGRWCPIDPLPGTFIVNFGCAMEILTRETATPVAAVAHRVAEQPRGRADRPDRWSYALFVDSSLDREVSPGLFGYSAERGLRLVADFDQFLTEIVRNTYQRDTSGLYESR